MKRLVLCLMLVGCGEAYPQESASHYAVRVVDFAPGEGAGYGAQTMPVLGPPQGRTDVVSLGREGVLILEMGMPIRDGEGADLAVYENPFVSGEDVWFELGAVAVSADAQQWFEWPCDREAVGPSFGACAGWHPLSAGGDRFDLADLEGLPAGFEGRYVRVRDVDRAMDASLHGPTNRGFDLDAVEVIVHENF